MRTDSESVSLVDERSRRPGSARFSDLALPAAAFVFNIATAGIYGIFRDEMYYLACGDHLAWGYVDQPPLAPLLARLTRVTLGDSQFALRILPALAAGLTVWLVMRMARDLGGGRFAAIAAGLAAFVAPVYLSLFSFFSMNAFDVLAWAALFSVLVRQLRHQTGGRWVLFGALAGVGLENKISVLFLAFGIAAGLLISRRRDVFRNPRFWLAVAIAALMFIPHLIWQAAHGWPTLEFMANARRFKMTATSPVGFVAEMLMHIGAAFPVMVSGVAFLLFSRSASAWRALGWAFVAILILMIATQAKTYYLAPAYSVLFAAGAVAIDIWTRDRRSGHAWRTAMFALLVGGGALLAPFARPLLPVDAYIRYSKLIGITPSSGERQRIGVLPQFFADRFGWREMAGTVAGVYDRLPPADQARACIFGQNYGEAGAIDYFGPKLGLPRAISAHNSYYMWGPGGCTGDVLIVIGDNQQRLETIFEQVELGATFRCEYCMPYENNLSIWIARGMKKPLPELWPQIKNFI